jgi:hypothetical protein
MVDPPTAPLPLDHPLLRDETVVRSLEGNAKMATIVLLVSGFVLGILSALTLFFGISLPASIADLAPLFEALALVVPLLLSYLVAKLVLTPRAIAREQARLASIPFPFAHEGYVRGLVSPSSSCVLDLHVTFARAADRARIAAAIDERDVRATVRWLDSNRAIVSSPIIQTFHEAMGSGGRNASYTSADRVHAWLVERALPLLEALHAELGVSSVSVEWH